MKDEHGEVMSSVPGLADAARVTIDECKAALTTLLGPDPDSRNPANAGRRIEPIAGGWLVLNHAEHTKRGSADERRAKTAERVRRFRERNAESVTERYDPLPVTPCNTIGRHVDVDVDVDNSKDLTTHVPLTFSDLWGAYPKREGSNPKKAAEHAYHARMKEKVDPETIRDGLIRYRRYCEAKGTIGTGYVMQAKRFFGPGEEWANDWKVGPQPANQQSKQERGRAALQRSLDRMNDNGEQGSGSGNAGILPRAVPDARRD
jgi:hypothetical protein